MENVSIGWYPAPSTARGRIRSHAPAWDMGPCVDEEVQVFERANGAVNDDLVSLAQLEVEGTGARFDVRASSAQGQP